MGGNGLPLPVSGVAENPHLARAGRRARVSPAPFERSFVGAVRSLIAADRGDAAAAVKLAEDAALHAESTHARARAGTDRGENDAIVDLRTTPPASSWTRSPDRSDPGGAGGGDRGPPRKGELRARARP